VYAVIDKFVELLLLPPALLPAERVGARRPAAVSDIPSVTCALTVAETRGSGLGRLVGPGDLPIRSTATVAVAAGADGFSADLRSVRLDPLPMRRDPSSVSPSLTERDVTVVNVTDAAHQVEYRLVAEPTRATEYRVDRAAARVVFGSAQQPGDRIELSHWTVEAHDPVVADRLRGVLALELWAFDVTSISALSRQLQDRLAARGAARERGFLRLEPARLDAAEGVVRTTTNGGTFAAWAQRLDYTFAFEGVHGATASSGVIRRIDVGIDDGLGDTLTIS
jgi:hypothetical protein